MADVICKYLPYFAAILSDAAVTLFFLLLFRKRVTKTFFIVSKNEQKKVP